MSATECCSSAWNAWWLEQLEIPEAATALGIFGWEDGFVTSIPLFRSSLPVTTTFTLTSTSTATNTTGSVTWTTSHTVSSTVSSSLSSTLTASSTVTSVTSTSQSVAVAGCLGLSVSDASLFSNSNDAETALREMLASAAGPQILSEYIQDVTMTVGSGCQRRLSERRRLQESLRVDYVIMLPTTIPSSQALEVANGARETLLAMPMEQATSLLQEEMRSIPSLAQLQVAVTAMTAAEDATSATTTFTTTPLLVAAFSVEEPLDSVNSTSVPMVMTSIGLAILMPSSLFIVWLRCQRRPKKTMMPVDSDVVALPVEEGEAELDLVEEFQGVQPAPRKKVKVRRRRDEALRKVRPKKRSEEQALRLAQVERTPAPPQLEQALMDALESQGVVFTRSTRDEQTSDNSWRDSDPWAPLAIDDDGVLLDLPPKVEACQALALPERPEELEMEEELAVKKKRVKWVKKTKVKKKRAEPAEEEAVS